MQVYFIVACLIAYIIFLTANEGLYAQNNPAVQNDTKYSIDTELASLNYKILTISTNKPTYIPGETILVTGSIFDTVPGKSDNVDLPLSLTLQDRLEDYNKGPPNTFNSVFVMTKNGSFSFSGFTAPTNITHYVISATTQNGKAAFVRFEVVNPLLTIQYLMLILGFGCFGGLILVILKSGKINFASGEILRFVLISGIVVSPIIGLLFSDSELGINSPISLIIKPENKKGETNTDAIWKNQWFIAVGGLKIDNYMSGILIPFYVIIFGLAGGYLRYLYNTSIKLWHLDPSSDVVASDMRLPLFNWTKTPVDLHELDNFKSFLIKSLHADWITEGSVKKEDNRLVAISKDQTISIIIEAFESDKIAIVKVGDDYYTTLRLEKQNGDLSVYQTIGRTTWSFYQSLSDLALLLLSPLLAIAAWFILTRGGDIDKYIVALVSFTVGLATNSIISTLTDFATQKVKTQTSSS